MGCRELIARGLAALLIVAAAGPGAAAAADPLTALGVLRPAKAAPAADPAFRALDGREMRLTQLRGQPVVLTFFTTW